MGIEAIQADARDITNTVVSLGQQIRQTKDTIAGFLTFSHGQDPVRTWTTPAGQEIGRPRRALIYINVLAKRTANFINPEE